MNVPSNLKYTKTHEWVEIIDEKTVRTDLTAYAAENLGDLVFINLPEVGDSVTNGEALGDVESVKAVSDFMSYVTGEVTAVNEQILDEPGTVNGDPFGTWFVEIGNVTEKGELLTPEEYEKVLAEEA